MVEPGRWVTLNQAFSRKWEKNVMSSRIRLGGIKYARTFITRGRQLWNWRFLLIYKCCLLFYFLIYYYNTSINNTVDYSQTCDSFSLYIPVDPVFWGNPLGQIPQKRSSLSPHYNLSAVSAATYLWGLRVHKTKARHNETSDPNKRWYSTYKNISLPWQQSSFHHRRQKDNFTELPSGCIQKLSNSRTPNHAASTTRIIFPIVGATVVKSVGNPSTFFLKCKVRCFPHSQ